MKREFTDKVEAEEFFNQLRAEKKWEIDAHILPDDKGYALQWIESKSYVAHDGKEYPDETWLTEAGELMLIQDLSEAHAKNILRMMIRKDRAAFELVTNLMASGEIQLPGDEEYIDAPSGDVEVPHTLH